MNDTDYDKFKSLMVLFGVGFSEETNKPNKIINFTTGKEKIDGYYFFYSDFEFDENGKFITIGIGE